MLPGYYAKISILKYEGIIEKHPMSAVSMSL